MLAKRLITTAFPLARRALALNSPSASLMAYRLAHHNPPAHSKELTMDDLPVPSGSWQEHYDSNQRKYNIVLLLGVGFLVITFATGVASGAFDLYMFPPDKPAPRSEVFSNK